MPHLPATALRVRRSTSDIAARRIEARTARRLAYFATRPDQIARRLDQLDREWDTERVLEANAASLALGGTVLGMLEDRRFLALPLVVTGFLLQHAIQGWCPPLPVLRRLGVRTAREIERERNALKALRGDFGAISAMSGADPRAQASAALRAAA